MILTSDALIGSTLMLSLFTATSPLLLETAREAADLRKDVIASTAVMKCNNSLIKEDDDTLAKYKNIKGVDKVEGSCGVSKGTYKITWKSGSVREIKYDSTLDLYEIS